jgi:hypothetical protein
MEINNRLFAFGATSCGVNDNHEFIDRYGHCLQCRPSNIAYLRRFDDKGYVYVAGSMELKCHKIGCSQDDIVKMRLCGNHDSKLLKGFADFTLSPPSCAWRRECEIGHPSFSNLR